MTKKNYELNVRLNNLKERMLPLSLMMLTNEVSTFTFLPSFEMLKWIRDSNDVAQYGFSFHGRLLTGL